MTSVLPLNLETLRVVNDASTRSAALSSFETPPTSLKESGLAVLQLSLPYLTLPTLLALRGHPVLNRSLDLDSQLWSLIDFQRDLIASEDFPVQLRDDYLVEVFPPGKGEAWGEVKKGMEELARLKRVEVQHGMVSEAKQDAVESGQVCESLEAFKEGLSEMSGGLLDQIDWSNVLLAGGSVVALLTGKSQDRTFAHSDLDLLLHGLRPDELIPKVNSLIRQIQSSNSLPSYEEEEKTWQPGDPEYYNSERKLLIIKGFNAISLIPPEDVEPRVIIQIILVSNPSAFDALAFFDLDHCTVGFTGERVVALPRAVRALSLGGWTGGVSFMDAKLSKKHDPACSNLAARILKYLPRGFSFALPREVLDILAAEKLDLQNVLETEGAKAAATLERTSGAVPLSGVHSLFRRSWADEGGRDIAGNHLHYASQFWNVSYGPGNAPAIKVISHDDLRTKTNPELAVELMHFHVGMISRLHSLIMVLRSELDETHRGRFSEYPAPHVSGFDRELLLGYKDIEETEEGWNRLVNLQYIVKLPRSILSHVKDAEAKMVELMESFEASTPQGDPSPRSTPVRDALDILNDPSASDDAMQHALDLLENLSISSSDPQPSRFIPECFPGAFRTTLPFNRLGNDGEGIDSPGDPFLATLTSANGEETAVTTESTSSVWRVGTMAGLWQFKGLDADIDVAREAVWQGKLNFPSFPGFFVNASGTVPVRVDHSLQRIRRYPNGKKATSLRRVLDKFDRDTDHLEKVVEAAKTSGTGGIGGVRMPAVGEWDGNRRRWILQWLRGEEMV
ncbi:hypothetical protein JCM10213v2_008599 [Rhodosporidiobolus nylandii]